MNATTRTRVSSATHRPKFASGASKKTAKSETRRNSTAPFSTNAIMGPVRRNEAFIIIKRRKQDKDDNCSVYLSLTHLLIPDNDPCFFLIAFHLFLQFSSNYFFPASSFLLSQKKEGWKLLILNPKKVPESA